ncbi:hypothetical protein HDV01_004873, partial [Terramyces sp. JEL0728]
MTLIVQSDGKSATITSSNGSKLKITAKAVSKPPVKKCKYSPPKIPIGSKPCFVCNQRQWKDEFESSTTNSELDPLHVFYQTIVEDYQIACADCQSKTVLGLIGYTGA